MLQPSEDDLAPCADCGQLIPFGSGVRAYPFGLDQALCWDCAIRRGGGYDELEDRWVRPPHLADLLTELTKEEAEIEED
jgi:hypothetical protein